MKKKIGAFLSTMAILPMLLQLSVFAANPDTGDQSGKWMWIMVGLLIVSLILIVLYIIMGIMKKK